MQRRIQLCLCVWAAFSAAAAAESNADLAGYYGFSPLEILKSDAGTHSLRVCDVSGDGLNDIILVNNQRSRIELYIQRSDPNDITVTETPEQVNELVGFGRFTRQDILLTIQPSSLVCGDLNGSGRCDIAVYAEPVGLYLICQDAPGPKGQLSWQSPHRIPIRDGLKSRTALACGDLDGDGRSDLALAGTKSVFVAYQQSDGSFADPVEYPSNYQIFEVRLPDFDGDGRLDLVCVTGDRVCPLHVRLGQADGQLGPVVPYKTEPFTDFELLDSPKTFLSIERVSGRLAGSRLMRPQATDEDPYAMLMYPLPDTGQNAKRDLVCADLDGDGRKDVLISRPGDAKMTLFRNSDTGLRSPEDFPALSDTVALAAADLNGNGVYEAVMLSIQERTIGVSRFEDGRMTFPTPIRTPLEPVAMTLADMNADGSVECLYVGRNEEDVRFLQICKTDPDGGFAAYGEPFKLEELKSNPQGMTAADIDQDGLTDVLIFRAYEEPLVIRQSAASVFEIVPRRQSQSGLIKNASGTTLSSADVNGDGKPELLLCQQNFARALVFGGDGAWSIVDQYNAAGRDDEIVAAVVYDMDDDGVREVILLDKKNQQLQILKPGEGSAYRVDSTIPVGDWSAAGQLKLFAADLYGTGRHLVLFDGDKFAFVVPRKQLRDNVGLALEQVFSWETKIRDGRYAHFAVGDVNSDGRDDIVLVEFRKNHLDILTYYLADQVVHLLQGTRFKLFEQKSFDREPPAGMTEPRELLIADVTGDSAPDIVALMHDRIVIYPQDH